MLPPIDLLMPWPPSANRYWRHLGTKVLVSREARAYISYVKKLALTTKVKFTIERLELKILAYPPDKRVRDIDNLIKVTSDSLEKAGFFVNDSQIDRLYVERKEVVKKGLLRVSISELLQ